MLQAGRSRVQDSMRWMNFSNLPNPSSRTGPWGLLSLKQKWVPGAEKCFWGVERGQRVGLTTSLLYVSQLSNNVGSSTSHNPIGLNDLLQGYLYFTFTPWMWRWVPEPVWMLLSRQISVAPAGNWTMILHSSSLQPSHSTDWVNVDLDSKSIWIGVSSPCHPSAKTDPMSETLCYVWNTGHGENQQPSVALIVIYHHQHPLYLIYETAARQINFKYILTAIFSLHVFSLPRSV
jgi:hypothetical protein